jgi:hypothetical protein
VENRENVLHLALAARDSGTRASRLLNVDQTSSAALSLDLACTQRLLEWENEREFRRLKLNRKLMRSAVSEAIAVALGQDIPPDIDDDDLDGTEPGTVNEDDLL